MEACSKASTARKLYQLLKAKVPCQQLGGPLRSTHEFIDDRCPNGINEMYDHLQHKDHKKK